MTKKQKMRPVTFMTKAYKAVSVEVPADWEWDQIEEHFLDPEVQDALVHEETTDELYCIKDEVTNAEMNVG